MTEGRVEAARWTALRSPYGVEGPSVAGMESRSAHERGGAEGQAGWLRCNRLVSVAEPVTPTNARPSAVSPLYRTGPHSSTITVGSSRKTS